MLSQVKPSAVVVYAVIAEHANADQEAWPSIRRISERSNLSMQTVRTACRELQEAGWLDIRGRATDDGRQTSNLYRVRRVQHSDAVPVQIREGGPSNFSQGASPETKRRTRPNEQDPLNSRSKTKTKYPTATETAEMLNSYRDQAATDSAAALRAARDELQRGRSSDADA